MNGIVQQDQERVATISIAHEKMVKKINKLNAFRKYADKTIKENKAT